MEEWRFGNKEKCRSRNMEEGREKCDVQRPNKLLRLNTYSSHEELRLNANEQQYNKLQNFPNKNFSTHESNSQKVVTELPEEIVREILMRVTYNSHYKLMSVCKSWKAMVDNLKFYEDRIRFGRCEELICLIEIDPSVSTRYRKLGQVVSIYNPVQDKREAALSFPIGYHFKYLESRCVSVNHKLVFMGLYKQDTVTLTEVVLIYDFSSCIWKQGTDMPKFHSTFACAVSPQNGLIYIAGGNCDGKNAMCYNVEKDKWEILPETQQDRILCQGFFNNDKFYVISSYDSDIEIFDTNTRLWTTLKNMWICGWEPDNCVAAFGSLYYFEDGVKEYDWKENVWRQISHFPSTLEGVSYGCTIWHDKIFLIGYENPMCKDRFYMFQPPKSGTMISERWTTIERPVDIYDYVMFAANVKI